MNNDITTVHKGQCTVHLKCNYRTVEVVALSNDNDNE